MKCKIILLLSFLLVLNSCGLQHSDKSVLNTSSPKSSTTTLQDKTEPRTKQLTVDVSITEDDPYESVIKSKIDDLSKGAGSKQLLNNHYYSLYDIDNDGTKELLFGTKMILWGYEGVLSNQERVEEIVLNQLYVTIDQKPQEIVYQPTWRWNNYFAESLGGRDILSNGIIRYYGGTPDYISYAFFRYSNGELDFIKALMSYEIAGTWVVVDNQGSDLREKISKEEFDCIKSEIEDGANVVNINWQPLESYGQNR